jgi:hypothetical protein
MWATRLIACLLACAIFMVFASACCHVNSLIAGESKINGVEVVVYAEGNPLVYFSRSSSRLFEEVMRSFGSQEVAAGLLAQLPKIVKKQLGWDPAAENPSATLQLQIKEMELSAADPVSDVSVHWYLRASLTDRASHRILWQDCLEWTLPARFANMEQLQQMDAEGRKTIVEQETRNLANRLAAHLLMESGNPRLATGFDD